MSEKKNTIESLMEKGKSTGKLTTKEITDAGPSEFVGLMKNSSYVLTMLWKNLILTLTRWILSMTTAQAIT